MAVVVGLAIGLISACGASGPGGSGRLAGSIEVDSQGSETSSAWAGFGFSPGAGIRDQGDGELADDLGAMAGLGAKWIRLDVDWSIIEADEGHFDWSAHDRLIDAALAADLQVLAMLAYTPAWARPQDAEAKHPPVDHDRFVRFAAGAVTRYRGRGVSAWQVWNEPNSPLFWSTGADPERYGQLLADTASAIRSVDPGATILSGGLAPATDRPQDGWLSPTTFLQGLVGAEALTDVDAVGVHPYSFPARPLDQDSVAWNSFLRLPTLHELLVASGAGPSHLWITEYGAPTGTHERAVSEEHQALLLTDALDAGRDWPWLGPMFLYNFRDYRHAPDDLESNYGIRRADGSRKLAFDELVRWAADDAAQDKAEGEAAPGG